MKLNIIAAVGNQGQIGLANKLPWKLRGDLNNFKKITEGHTVIMGRKTFESIAKPLANRKNIVLTRDKQFFVDGCFIANSIQSALELAKNDENVFICGGETVYKEAINNYDVDRIYMTLVDYDGEADAFFPKINFKKWRIIKEEKHEKDDDNEFDYNLLELEKDN